MLTNLQRVALTSSLLVGFLGAAWAVTSGRGVAQPAAAEEAPAATVAQNVERRLAELERRRGAESMAGPILEQALRALERAKEAEARGDHAAARRARMIADAATLLADRRIALGRERQMLRAAQRRLERARERADQARAALAHARTQQAEVRARIDAEASEGEESP